MGYAKYAYKVKPLGKKAYFPRAEDPTKIIVKAFKDAMTASHAWRVVQKHYTKVPEARPVIFGEGGGRYQTTYGATVMTPEQAENIPSGSNEIDLEVLARLNKEWQDKWTHENTTNRIQTLLAMLGDLEVSQEDVSYSRWLRTKNKTVFRVKGQTLILLGET